MNSIEITLEELEFRNIKNLKEIFSNTSNVEEFKKYIKDIFEIKFIDDKDSEELEDIATESFKIKVKDENNDSVVYVIEPDISKIVLDEYGIEEYKYDSSFTKVKLIEKNFNANKENENENKDSNQNIKYKTIFEKQVEEYLINKVYINKLLELFNKKNLMLNDFIITFKISKNKINTLNVKVIKNFADMKNEYLKYLNKEKYDINDIKNFLYLTSFYNKLSKFIFDKVNL